MDRLAPIDHIGKNSSSVPKPGIGFQISQIDNQAYHAIRDAYDYVIQARDKGAQIRTWVIEAKDQTDGLVGWAEDFLLNKLNSQISKDVIQKKIEELALQESKILRVVHQYLYSVNAAKDKMKLLNPPLTSNQLQPFLNAIADDRKKTIVALEVLTTHLEKLTRLKMAICRDFQKYFGD